MDKPLRSVSSKSALIQNKTKPRKSKLVIILEMIGANRIIQRDLEIITHDPKPVPDIPY